MATEPGRGLSLESLQERLWGLIRAPRGVQAACREAGYDDLLATCIVGDERGSAVNRLETYANMYFYRLHESLASDFPKLAAALDKVGFHNFVTDYLAACPSEHPSLRFLGRRLPTFLQEHHETKERPWLPDLAALEWARVDVFDREDEPVLTMADVTAHAAEEFARLHLSLRKAHQVVPVSHAVDDAWRELGSGAQPSRAACEIRPLEGALLVWRKQDLSVCHRPIDSLESVCLALLKDGIAFLELCAVLGRDFSNEEAAQRALQLLLGWTTSELLVT